MGTHSHGEELSIVLSDHFDPEATGHFDLSRRPERTGRHRVDADTVQFSIPGEGRHRKPDVPKKDYRKYGQIIAGVIAIVTLGFVASLGLHGDIVRSETMAITATPASSTSVPSSVPALISEPVLIPESSTALVPIPEPTLAPVPVPRPEPVPTVEHMASVAFCDDAASCKTYAKQIVPTDQWTCFDELIQKESGWRPFVWNAAGSGAYGLVQALPASKMASEGADWETNGATQLRWGLKYMDDRYGSPCGALSFWNSHRWY